MVNANSKLGVQRRTCSVLPRVQVGMARKWLVPEMNCDPKEL